MVVFDTKFLTLMLDPKARPPKDPLATKIIDRLEDRIERLCDDLDAESERIIIPTPVLAEFLIFVGKSAAEYLSRIGDMRNVLVKPFDEKAAIELAAMEVEDRAKMTKKGGSASPWAKVRFDRARLRTRS